MIQIYFKREVTTCLLLVALSVLVCFQAKSHNIITNDFNTAPDHEATTNLVQLNVDGTLNYTADALGNTLIDFGMVGYRQSVCPIPNVSVVVTLNPSVGDRTADIQAAIDSIEAMPQNQYGHRGALLLTAGYYELQGELLIDASGVVIRGEGNGTDGTVLRHFGTEQVGVLTISASASIQEESSTLKNVVDTYVPIGAKKVTVESSHTFEKGDPIIFTREPYQSWIEAIGMDTLFQFCGDGHSDWTPASYTIDSKHNIVDVIGDTIFFDSPIVDPIEPGYAGAYVQKYTWVGIEECGVENIRFESQTVSDDDENHARHAITMEHLRNGWFRNIKSKDFINNCTNISNSYQITVDSCEVEDYVSLVSGGRRYGFAINGSSQLILVKNCKSNEGRHCFASGSRVRGPNVFYNCTATNASTDSGPHHRWSTGFLYESLVTNMHLWVQNRVCSGSGHGWTGAQHLFWNCDVGGSIILQDPPTEQTNWAIGCTGTITNEGAFPNFDAPLGYVESHNNPISFSLYENQARIFRTDNLANNSCLICPDNPMNDVDLDGVCNDEDVCPSINDNLIGKACDDGDPCTELSVYKSDCNCVPVFNFALPGEASMSSGLEYRATYLNDEIIDNSILSYTSENSPYEWMQIDLGTNRNIDEVLIWNRTNCCSERLSNGYVLVSDTPFPDDTDLNAALANADFTHQMGNTSQEDLITIDVQQFGRYVRLQKSGNNLGGNSLNILELQIMGDTLQRDTDNDGFCDSEDTCAGFDDSMDVDGDNIPNFCDCHPAVATEDDGNIAVNTLDGDLSTRWSAFGNGQAIQYCLNETLRLNCIDLAFFKGDSRSAIFDVEILTDNDTWVTVLDNVISSGTTLQLERFTFPPIMAHKIRITGHGNSQNEWNSLTEVTWANCIVCTDIQLHAWLEGAYDSASGEMSTILASTRKLLPGQIPVSPIATPTPAGQPYHIAPWNYSGIEGAGWTNANYTGNETDWILVSFRTGIAKSTEVAQTAGLLMRDGVIELPDRCALPSTISDSLYVVLEHRNHIGIMTPQLLEIVNGILTYDFRTSDSYRDATSFGQKQMPNGEWVMFAGDANQMDFPSFDVNGTDKTEWFDNNGVFDYYLSPDFNLDGDVNGQDKSLWFENNGISSRVPK